MLYENRSETGSKLENTDIGSISTSDLQAFMIDSGQEIGEHYREMGIRQQRINTLIRLRTLANDHLRWRGEQDQVASAVHRDRLAQIAITETIDDETLQSFAEGGATPDGSSNSPSLLAS